jgi:hypothetical protein
MTGIESRSGNILFDVHVHIYDCFSLQNFFDSAIKNFKNETRKNGIDADFQGIIVLTDWLKENWFQYFFDSMEKNKIAYPKTIGNWSFHRTKEHISLVARRTDGESLFVVAGKKIITAENLEVLALATKMGFDVRIPLVPILDQIKQYDAIPVIPWAVGKWMGKRGRVIKDLLDKSTEPDYFLCDNGNRPNFWPRPTFFNYAEKKGIRVLAGSDALHFASEACRVGSFANLTHGTIDPDYPAMELKKMLRNPNTRIQTYGKLEKPVRFFRNQLAMQLLKRKNRQKLIGR